MTSDYNLTVATIWPNESGQGGWRGVINRAKWSERDEIYDVEWRQNHIVAVGYKSTGRQQEQAQRTRVGTSPLSIPCPFFLLLLRKAWTRRVWTSHWFWSDFNFEVSVKCKLGSFSYPSDLFIIYFPFWRWSRTSFGLWFSGKLSCLRIVYVFQVCYRVGDLDSSFV